MDRNSALLLEQVRELELILRSAGVEHWADWLDKDASRIAAGNLNGIRHLLSAFGGMGSLSDVYFSDQPGGVEEGELEALNERVNALRSSIYELATRILRENQ